MSRVIEPRKVSISVKWTKIFKRSSSGNSALRSITSVPLAPLSSSPASPLSPFLPCALWKGLRPQAERRQARRGRPWAILLWPFVMALAEARNAVANMETEKGERPQGEVRGLEDRRHDEDALQELRRASKAVQSSLRGVTGAEGRE